MSIQSDYEEATVSRLLEKMKEGKIPWRKPWDASQVFDLPMNPTTGNAYHGMNTVVLLSEGYSDPRWLTYKQAEANGWQVRKGQKSTQIGYFQRTEEKKDEAGNKVTVELDRPRFFRAFVFNAEQIEGIPALPAREAPKWDSHERLDLLKSDLGVEVRHGGNEAYFSPFHDYVQMPNREQFPSLESYSSTLLHEIGHWTGHSSRLKRDQTGRFGTQDYAFEELVAEMSSLMMGAEFEIPHDFTQHASYIQSWMSLLKEDPKAIFRAASQATKVKSFLLEHEKTWTPEMAKPREQSVAQDAQPAFHIDGLVGSEFHSVPEAMKGFLADRDNIMQGHNLVMVVQGREFTLIGHDWVNDGSDHRYEYCVPELKAYHTALIRKDTTPEKLAEAEQAAIQAVAAYPALEIRRAAERKVRMEEFEKARATKPKASESEPVKQPVQVPAAAPEQAFGHALPFSDGPFKHPSDLKKGDMLIERNPQGKAVASLVDEVAFIRDAMVHVRLDDGARTSIYPTENKVRIATDDEVLRLLKEGIEDVFPKELKFEHRPELDRLRMKWVMDVFDAANDRDLVPEMLGIHRSVEGGFLKFQMGSTHLAYLDNGRYSNKAFNQALFSNLFDVGMSDHLVWAANQKEPRVEAMTAQTRQAKETTEAKYWDELRRVYGDEAEAQLPHRNHKDPELRKAMHAFQDASKAWIRDVNEAKEGLLNAVLPKEWEAKVANQVESLKWLKEQLKDAVLGVDANRSFHFLQDVALAEDVMPMARLRKADEHTPYERLDITYLRKDGVELPIRSVLPINGKALTYIGEERVPGTFPSSDRESITDALRYAISETKNKVHVKEAIPTPEPEKAPGAEVKQEQQEKQEPHMILASRDQELSFYPALQKTIIALEELKATERTTLLKESASSILVEYGQVLKGTHASIPRGSSGDHHATFYETQLAKWFPDFAKNISIEWENNKAKYSKVSGLSEDRIHAVANAQFWEADNEVRRRDRPVIADEKSNEWALQCEHLCTKTTVWPHGEDAKNTRALLTKAAKELRDGEWNKALENLKDAGAYEGLQDMEMKQNGMMTLADDVQNTWAKWQQQNGLGQVVTPRMKREFEAIPKNLADITPETRQAIDEHNNRTRQSRQSTTQQQSKSRGSR